MALAPLLSIPRGAADWSVFSFNNFDSHNRIAIAIFKKYGTNIQTFPLDPIPWNDLATWARNHQEAHNLQNGILGIAGADFTSGDLSREDELASFTRLHGSEHQLAELMLGIG
jgi:hypothetical protein